ncbi:MAG: 30S ribosomal protein S20 [Planctomycetota bacterium]|nr:30S ribosomal protein S20 [Planctomycetota bacterium]
MANSRQANKRIRQNARLRLRNNSVKSELKTLTKKLVGHIESQEKELAQELFPRLIAKMDKATRRRIYHANTIARQKSRLHRLYNHLMKTS